MSAALRGALEAIKPWEYDATPSTRYVHSKRRHSTLAPMANGDDGEGHDNGYIQNDDDDDRRNEHGDRYYEPAYEHPGAAATESDAEVKHDRDADEEFNDGQLPFLRDSDERSYRTWPAQEDDPRDADAEDMLDSAMEYLLPPPPAASGEVEPGGWDPLIDQLQHHFDKLYVDEFNASRIHTRGHHVDEYLRNNAESGGAQRDRDIRKALNNMGIVRSELQVRFHEVMLQASAKNIYGSDFDACQEQIFARSGKKEIRCEVLVQWPRRFGKTTVVAMGVAALACLVPGIRIAIFSTVQRTSKKLMEEIHRFVCQISGAKERISAHNKEELHVSPNVAQQKGFIKKTRQFAEPERISIIYSYPASVTGTRGFTVHEIVIDEASHINEEVWKFSIVPALGTEGMVLLALTTAQSVTNFFSVLIAKKRLDGSQLFETLVLTLVCDDCQLAGTQKTCTHRLHLLPAWKPKARQELIQQILGEQDANVYLQEAMGAILENTGNVFNKKHIDELARRPHFSVTHSPREIFSFVDPSGGSHYSSQAIVDIFFDGPNVVVTPLFFLSFALRGHESIALQIHESDPCSEFLWRYGFSVLHRTSPCSVKLHEPPKVVKASLDRFDEFGHMRRVTPSTESQAALRKGHSQ